MKSTIKILEVLLSGKFINCKTMLKDFGYSNASRELVRKIEKPFEIILRRDKINAKNRYGESVSYFNYSLNPKDKKRVERLIKMMNKAA